MSGEKGEITQMGEKIAEHLGEKLAPAEQPQQNLDHSIIGTKTAVSIMGSLIVAAAVGTAMWVNANNEIEVNATAIETNRVAITETRATLQKEIDSVKGLVEEEDELTEEIDENLRYLIQELKLRCYIDVDRPSCQQQ